jgi:hypothetical protein
MTSQTQNAYDESDIEAAEDCGCNDPSPHTGEEYDDGVRLEDLENGA